MKVFHKFLSETTLINLEMSVLYFLENFADQAFADMEFEEGVLTSKNALFVATCKYQSLFNRIEQFLTLCINKCLTNLSYRNYKLSKY